jgi:ABC-type uncharacterized transport system auxiliary subunit
MKHLIAALTLCALAACGSAPAVEDRYYRPAVAVPTAPHAPLKVRLIVEPFEMHGLYSDRPLVYVDRSGAYQQSNHNNWIEPPSIMLASSLLDTLRAAYGNDAAFLPDARVAAEITVRTRIRRFERLPRAEPVQALLSLEIVVTGRGSKLIGSVDFEESAAAGKNIPDYVQTQAALLAKAYAKLLDLLDQHADELGARS